MRRSLKPAIALATAPSRFAHRRRSVSQKIPNRAKRPSTVAVRAEPELRLVLAAVMRKRKSPKAPSYAVGYGRPPKATQFAKGESGNPRGRPKGTRTVGAMLQEILRQKIAVTENGRTRRLPALEVILRRLANDAMRSEPRALKLLLALNDRYGDSR